jgi:hypothetical protein
MLTKLQKTRKLLSTMLTKAHKLEIINFSISTMLAKAQNLEIMTFLNFNNAY